MRVRIRAMLFVVAAGAAVLSLWSSHVPAVANGTIVTTNATILSGESATVGVTIDPCAPEVAKPMLPPVGAIPAQGTFSQALPAMPSTGDGSDGGFSTTTDMLGMAGGTYQYTSYTVRDGATVSYANAVTILVQGDVTIEGRVESNESGGSITILAGGSITILAANGSPVTGVQTSGSGSTIRLEAGERVEAGVELSPIAGGGSPSFQSELLSTGGGAVVVRAHGVAPSQASGVELSDVQIRASNGGVVIGAAEHVSMQSCELNSRFGDMLLQSFGELMLLEAVNGYGEVGNVFVESGASVEIANGSQLRAAGADLAVGAFGGNVFLTDDSRLFADDGLAIGVSAVGDGEVAISASGDVSFSGVGYVEASGTAGIHVTAHGGDVTFEAGGGADASYLFESQTGDIEVLAANDVFLGGFSYLETSQGRIDIRAQNDFRQEGETYVSAGGDLDARADDEITATTFLVEDTSSPNPYFEGRSILLAAGDGGIDLEVDFLTTSDGSITAIADGDVRISAINFVQSTADITVRSIDGSIDVQGTTVQTFPTSATGAILIESFGGSTSVIDASDATIQASAAAALPPGTVDILIHAAGPGEIDSFVLPKTAKLRINTKKPEKSSLRVAGFFDTGVEDEALAGEATIWIDGTRIDATLVPKGRNLTFQSDSLKFKVKPTRSGSSRAKFSLLLKGDVANLVDPDGPLTLRFQTQSADGEGTVVLQKGGYKLGKKAGALTAPNLFPFKLKATHKGPGKDSLAFQAGLASDAGSPTQIPDVTIRYGDVFEVTVSGSDFTKKGDNFLAKSPPSAPEISKLNINFAREKVDLIAKGLDLGALPSEAGPVTLSIAIGEIAGTVSVRVAPVAKRGQNKY